MAKKNERIMKIALRDPKRKNLGKLVRKYNLDIWGTGGLEETPEGTATVEGYVPETALDKMKTAGLDFDVIEDATKVGKARQKQVGQGDRFEGGKIAPKGLGTKE